MFDLSSLKEAQKKTQKKREAKLEEFDPLLNESIKMFNEARLNPDSDKFRHLAEKFVNCIEIRKDRVEPYAYLSAIFFFFKDDDEGFMFYEKAKLIDASFTFLKELEENLISKL